MRHVSVICFSIVLVSVLVGWVSGWKRAMKTGNAAYVRGAYDEADGAFREAIQRASEKPAAYYNLGTVLYRKQDFGAAITAFRESLARHSRQTENPLHLALIYYNLGNAQFQVGSLREAIAAYKDSLRLNPQDMDAKYNLALALQLLKQQELSQQQRARENPEQQTEPDDSGEAEALRILDRLSKNEKRIRQKLLREQRKSGYRRVKDW